MLSYRDPSLPLAAMSWGAEDLSAAIGPSSKYDANGELSFTYKMARSLCLAGAVAAGVQPVDGVFADFRDEAGLTAEAEAALRHVTLAQAALDLGDDLSDAAQAVIEGRTFDDQAHDRAGFLGVAGAATLLEQRFQRRRAGRVPPLLFRGELREGAAQTISVEAARASAGGGEGVEGPLRLGSAYGREIRGVQRGPVGPFGGSHPLSGGCRQGGGRSPRPRRELVVQRVLRCPPVAAPGRPPGPQERHEEGVAVERQRRQERDRVVHGGRAVAANRGVQRRGARAGSHSSY